jgi:N-acetylglucosaminyl-diphospho-decaprenol L-rhamnosyltransferase
VRTERLTVIIVNFRSADLSLQAVRSLGADRALLPGLRAIIVDGGSGDGSAERLAEALAADEFQGWAELLALPINGGFGWANNQGMLREIQRPDAPEFIFLLNPDAQVTQGAIPALLDHLAAHGRCAAAGAQLLDEQGEPQVSAHRFPTALGEFARATRTGLVQRLLGDAGAPLPIGERACEADWVSGASVMLRTEALRHTGLFDDGFFLYFEEVELMWRLKRAGWQVWYVPSAKVIHLEGAVTGAVEAAAKRMPRYWYDSQRRYFALTSGRAGAIMALGAWQVGHLLWRLRRLLRSGRGAAVPHMARDRVRFGLPRSTDTRRSVPSAASPPGSPPAWMRTNG